jgi:putative membrane protein
MDFDPRADIPPRRQQPAVIFLDAVRGLGALVVPVLILLFTREGDRQQQVILAISAVYIVGSLIFQFVAWRHFTFEVIGSDLRVRSGVLERKERLVPLERIQSVDLHETLLQRLFGVVGVRVETAAGGSEAADVKIDALTREDAEHLRRRLGVIQRGAPAPGLQHVDGAADGAGGAIGEAGEGVAAVRSTLADDGEVIRRLSTRELLLAGVTSGTIGPALAVVGFFSQIIDDILPNEVYERIFTSATALGPRAIIGLVIGLGLFAWILATVGAVLTYGNFELRRAGDRVIISHGLLDRRRRTVPVARMQAIVVNEGLLRRPFGLASVSFESAGYGQEQGESAALWPLLRKDDAMALVAEVAPSLATNIDPAGLAGPPPRALSRYLVIDIVSWAVFGGLILGATWAVTSGVLPFRWTWLHWWWGGLVLAALPLVAVSAFMRYRDAGWRIDPSELLVISSGGFTRKTTVVPRRRIQFRIIERNVFQRRAELATLKVAIASGGGGSQASIEHLDQEVVSEIVTDLGPPPVARRSPASPVDWTAASTISP